MGQSPELTGAVFGFDAAAARSIAPPLDARLAARGRAPAAVKRTIMASVLVWHDDAERDRRLRMRMAYLNPERLGPGEFAAARRASGDLVGSPDEVIEQLHAWAALGVQEIMMDVYLVEDDDLDVVAAEVLPRL